MEENKVVLVKELKEFFRLQQVTGDEESLKREITVPDINRPGLELTGFYSKSDFNRVVLLGQKEIAYLSELEEEKQIERFNYMIENNIPCVIVTHSEKVPKTLLKVAIERNFPVFSTYQPSNIMIVDIIGFLDEKLANFDNVHGVLMSVFGMGVLIEGKSGIGKSELALDLINRGHALVADDRVDCYRIHNSIIGKAPPIIQRYLEIRGVGIIDVVQIFGAKAFKSDINIEYIIELQHFEEDKEYERLGIDETYKKIMGIKIPKMILPIEEGRNISVIVETAIQAFRLKQMGNDIASQFEQNVIDHIQSKI